MPQLKLMTQEDWDRQEAERAALFSGAKFGSLTHVKEHWLDDLDQALEAKREEALQSCIAEKPYLAQYVTPNTGHHGIWLFPKQVIAVKKASGDSGLIPDFLAVTSNSDGFQWWVIELKRADEQFANRDGTALSTMANKALVQCSGYLNHFDRYLETIKSTTGIEKIIRPRGVLLLIGDSRSENEAQLRVRANINESLADRMTVISYDRMRRHLISDIGYKTRDANAPLASPAPSS